MTTRGGFSTYYVTYFVFGFGPKFDYDIYFYWAGDLAISSVGPWCFYRVGTLVYLDCRLSLDCKD